MTTEIKLAVIVNEPGIQNVDRLIERRLMPYQAAASYAAKIVADPANYTFTGTDGHPRWNHFIEIIDDAHLMVAQMSPSGKLSWNEIIDHSDVYPAVQYVLAAMRRARDEARAVANEEMTPTEIERELNLKAGVVRKYVYDHREQLIADRIVRYADERTLLIKRGFALRFWGRHGERQAMDMQASALLKDWVEAHEAVWTQLEALEYTPDLTTDFAEYFKTETRQIGDTFARIEKVVPRQVERQTFYRVMTWNKAAHLRDFDLTITKQGNRVIFDYNAREYLLGIKLAALAVFGLKVG